VFEEYFSYQTFKRFYLKQRQSGPIWRFHVGNTQPTDNVTTCSRFLRLQRKNAFARGKEKMFWWEKIKYKLSLFHNENSKSFFFKSC